MSDAAPAERDPVEEWIDVAGTRIRLLAAGEGRPLLYLHGTGDVGAWRAPLGILATRYRVIRPDHPGFIESDGLPEPSVAAIAALYSALLDRLGLDDVLVMGASLGGWIATELALREPERVTGLVIVDAVGIVDPAAPLGDMFALTPVEVAELAFPAGPLRDAAVARAAAPADPVTARRTERSLATAAAIASDPLMSDPTLAERAGALRVPVTLVWGAEDGLVPPAHARRWLAAIPQARLHIIPDAGHGPHTQRPDAFLAATRLMDTTL